MSWQALNWCAGLSQVRGPRRAVLWAMCNRHNIRTGMVSMGMTAIGAEAGLSRSAAHRTVAALVKDGLVQVVLSGRGPNAPTLYLLPAASVPPERDGSQLSTGLSTVPATVPLRRDGSVPLRWDALETAASAADEQPSHLSGTEPSHFGAEPSHLGGTFHGTKRQPALDQNRTVVTQEPAAALAPDGAAAKRQGGDAEQVPRQPSGRPDWRAAVWASDDEPNPNGRDPPVARLAR